MCLRDIAKRGRDWRVACYSKLFVEAQAGFLAKKSSVHSTHGSLLCIGELLNITPPDYMSDKFKDTCEYVLRYRDNSNALIVRTVISLIPRLAGRCPRHQAATAVAAAAAVVCVRAVCGARCLGWRDAPSVLPRCSLTARPPSLPLHPRARSFLFVWLLFHAPVSVRASVPATALSPHSFSRNYLSMCLDYLIEQMKVRHWRERMAAVAVAAGCVVQCSAVLWATECGLFSPGCV